MAAREIAKALALLSTDELRKIAAEYDVDITDALEGEYFTKADLADEDESLTDLAKRIGSHALIDAAKKLDALAKRADEQDAFMKRANAMLDEVEALNKRGAVPFGYRR
jgi:hypothetical protein